MQNPPKKRTFVPSNFQNMRISIVVISCFFCCGLFAQNEPIDFNAVDSLYREDQFYCNLSFSNLQDTNPGFNHNKISAAMSFGFLRDFPINKARTWAIAAGLGYTYSGLNQNLGITEINGGREYEIIRTGFSKNKQILHYADLPIEIRWRTSTPQSHKFWRIYTGFKLSYLFFDQYKYQDADVKIKINSNPDLNKIQYGAYMAAGWNTWNAYIYYGLNPIFKSAAIDGQPVNMHAFNLGLMFYIL